MIETEITPVGLTRDTGWELGARRTVAAPLGAVWSHLIGAGLPTTIGIHQERLASEAERTELLAHWHAVLDRLEAELA